MTTGGDGRQRRPRQATQGYRTAGNAPEQNYRPRHATDTPQQWPDRWFEPRSSAAPQRRGDVKPTGRHYAKTQRSSQPTPRRQDRQHGEGASQASSSPRLRNERPRDAALRSDAVTRKQAPVPEGARRGMGNPNRQPASKPSNFLRRVSVTVVVLLALFGLFHVSGLLGEGGGDNEVAVTSPEHNAPMVDEISPSRPLEMTVPKLGLHANFEPDVCKYKNGAIDPSTLSEACVYTAEDRPDSLPGTNAPDIVVVAGHAAAGVPAIFDKLYDPGNERHTVAIGDAMYVRTEQSGERWLKYQATDLHEPEKSALSQSADIWGTGPMPGRLLTITCIQPANPFAPSVKNAVVGWQFQGVVGADEARL